MGAAPRPPERERVRVVCRVRPFTARERAVSLGACLASAAAARTSVTARDPVDGTRHAFSFDEVFTAHGDEARGAGAADSPAGGGGGGGGGNSRAPAAIYARHGRPLVAAAARGFNCTALCYGQTGSGKTACMFGVEECAGLVPQAVADLCAEVASQPNAQLFVSLLEIYNERATDLLAEPCGGNGGDGGGDSSRRRRPPLRVRECPERGPYIAELSERLVMATAEGGDMAGASQGARRAMSALAEGLARRSVHATAANAQSSRAHTVLTLRVRARVAPGGATRESALNLVDLAGSERAGAAANASSSPGQAAARLREGNHINRGLSALGNCVRALSERPAGSAAPGAGGNTPRGTRHVPYRDSMLTWLLKRSLDGHAKVLVVATLAPGTHTFAETLSTLRYADRMRKIETAAVVARPKGGVTASTASSAAAARERIVRRKAVSAPEARELQRKRALGALKQQQFNRQLSAGHERGAGAAARRPLIARREVKESSPVRRRQAFVSPYASPYASPAKPAALARKQVSRPSGRAQRVQVERLDDVAAVRLLPDVVVGQAVRTPRERLPAKRPAVAPVAKSPSGRGDKLQRLQLEILALARDLGGGAAAAKASPPRLAHAPSRQERPVLAF